MFLATAPAQAATWTWDYAGTGNPTDVWATDGQWTTSGFPDFSADPGTEDLVFEDSTNTNVLLRDINNRDRIKSLTFTADAPAYTFSRDSYPTQHLVLSQDGILTNDSNDVQTFNSGLALEPAYTVNANTGDSGTNYAFIVADHLYLDSSGTTGPTYNGPYDMHVTGTGGGALQGATTGVVFTINDAKLLVDGGMNIRGTFTLNGTGQVIIKGAWAPASTSNTVKAGNGTLVLDGASTTTKTMTINAGIVRIGNDTALGATANTTTIGGGTNDGRLELYNGINSAESIVLNGRASDAAPHISNYSGSNTLSGTITAGTSQSGHYTIASASGSTLTLAGTIDQPNTGTQILNLGGAGDIALDSNVTGTWSKLAKQGSGTMTLGSSCTISAAAIDVQAGILDVNSLSGGLQLGSSQTLMGTGTVLGSVSTQSGSTVAPGDSAGTLTVNGDLTFFGGDYLSFDLSEDPEYGVNDRIDLNQLTGYGNGDLAFYGSTNLIVTPTGDGLGEGVYRLMDYEGTLTGNAANFSLPSVGGTTRQSLTILTGNDVGGTAHQVNLVVEGAPLHLTWSGNNPNYDWDVVGDSNWNSGSQKFYNLDFVTFNDSGSNASPVNIAEDVTPASITVDNPTKDYVFAGAGGIRGSTGLTKDGAGKLTIVNSGTNDFSGAIAVDNGTLQVGSGGTLGSLGGGDVTLGMNGTLTYQLNNEVTVYNNLHGSGNLRQEGTNILTLSGANADYTGTVTVAAGTLKLGSATALGDATGGTVVADGGVLDVNGVNVPTETLTVQGAGGGSGALINTNTERSDVNAVVLAGNTTVGGIGDIDRTQGILNFAAMQGNSHDLVKVGSNTVQFDDAGETGLGNVTVNEGNLFFYGTATLGDPTKTVTIANNAVLSFYNSPDPTHEKPIVIDSTGGKIGNFKYNSTVDSPITLNGNLTLESKSHALRLTGALTGTGSLDRNTFLAGGDTGTVYLISDGNNYSGTTTITAGTLSVGNGGTTGSLGGTGDITLGDNGTLRYDRQGINNVSRNIVGTGLSALAVAYGSGDLDFKDTVFNVSGNNTYTGDTRVDGGTLVLSSATGLGDTTGKTIIDNPVQTVACVAMTGGITVAENFEIQPREAYAPINATYTPHLQNISGHNTLSGAIGTGTAGGAGVTTIRSEGTAPGDLLTISGSISCEMAGVSLWLRGPGNGEVTGMIIGSGADWTGLNVADGGTWTLKNTASYAGYTAIYGGTLALGEVPDGFGGVLSAGSISSSNAVILYNDSATLQVTGLTDPTFTVPSTMWLVGCGTVAGNVASSYGTIAPSGPVNSSVSVTANTNLPIGTLNVQGNLTLSGYDYLQFKLGG
ncbi:MAG: autotransporter-associated beta strand repeat-containing protein, partial [Pirellulales bacterium]|nr:autotransporter-associated beta strand repeat-containing protein [Pirellulales bacterium]